MLSILYIVVPCYNEEQILHHSNGRLIGLLHDMTASKLVSEQSRICYVNDGSVDATWTIITELSKQYEEVSAIKLARNYGHQNAVFAGMQMMRDKADAIITIDADLQDDINVIPRMVEDFIGGCDIVYGVRKERKTDTLFKRITAQMFYKTMSHLGVETIYNHADFRLMSNRAVDQLCDYPERNLYLRGIIPLLGYKTSKVYYDREERLAGESKYPLRKMLGLAADGITSFSIKPIRIMLLAGLFMLLVSVAILIYVFVSLTEGKSVAGWTSIMLSLWFIGGMVITCLGIVGEYIGKIFVEVKRRPRYNVEEVLS